MRIAVILLCLVIFCFSGCANAKVTRPFDFWLPNASAQVKVSEKVFYWPGRWKKDLKDIIKDGIIRELERYSIPIVDSQPDVVVLINQIETGGWSDHIRVAWVEVIVEEYTEYLEEEKTQDQDKEKSQQELDALKYEHYAEYQKEQEAKKEQKELFKVTYYQNPALFGEIYKFWGVLKNPYEIAKIVGRKIVRELKR